jgi:small-conductance mechanosensitive channel
MVFPLLSRAFGPTEKSGSPWQLLVAQFYVWFAPFIAGALLGLATVKVLYPPGSRVVIDLLASAAIVGWLIVMWVKCPWLRHRPLAVLFTGVAGYGAMVSSVVLALRLIVHVNERPGMGIVAVAGAVLFIAGLYYTQVFRSTPKSRGTRNDAG